MQTQAVILTAQAPAYIDALCTHFAEDHAQYVQHDTETTGLITLPGNGACLLRAQDGQLILELQAPKENTASLADFLSRHIHRLPHGRELSVVWHETKGETV
jgi:hypothetical protein